MTLKAYLGNGELQMDRNVIIDDGERKRTHDLIIKELKRFNRSIDYSVFSKYMYKYHMIEAGSLLYFGGDLVNEGYIVIYKLKEDLIQQRDFGSYKVDWVIRSERYIKLTFKGLFRAYRIGLDMASDHDKIRGGQVRA